MYREQAVDSVTQLAKEKLRMVLPVWQSHEDCSMLEASLGFRVGALSVSSKENKPQAAEKEVGTCQRMGLQKPSCQAEDKQVIGRYMAGAKSTRRWGMRHAQLWRCRNVRVENTPEKSWCVSI